MKQTLVLSLLALALAWPCGDGLALTLVQDGKPVATIVRDAPPEPEPEAPVKGRRRRRRGKKGLKQTPPDVRAAELLATWIAKITGAKLPVAATAPEGGAVIYVGAAARQAGLDLSDIKSPTNQGLRIVVDGERVLIGGQDGGSTVKAAARFLEELGCRYLMPGPLGEVFPSRQTLEVGKLDISEKPVFVSRKLWAKKDPVWGEWNGLGGKEFETRHAWNMYISPALFDEHPDWFPMIRGKRVKPKKHAWLCPTNPEMRAHFADNLIARIKGGKANPSISPPDGGMHCQCSTCKALDDPNSIEPSSNSVAMTNRMIDFYSYLAGRVAKECPDSLLDFYCYSVYTIPPTNIKGMLPKNLCPFPAPIRSCRYHHIDAPNCPSRQHLAKTIAGWQRISHHLGYRTYNFSLAEVTVPLSLISYWKHDIPYLRDKGFVAINNESMPSWNIMGPHSYLSARLMYNPDLDAEALMDDYFMKFFGPAAGPLMKAYWMGIDERFVNMKTHSGSFFYIQHVYTPEFLQQSRTLIDKAKAAAAGNEAYAARIAMTEDGFHNAEQYCQWREAVNRGDMLAAKTVLDELMARAKVAEEKGYGSRYSWQYPKRFLGGLTEQGAKITAAPNKMLKVLPDNWRFTWDEKGVETSTDPGTGLAVEKIVTHGYEAADLDDSKWQTVATWSDTLSGQGLPDKKTILWYRTRFDASAGPGKLSLFFCEIDGNSLVYVNGKPVDLYATGKDGAAQKLGGLAKKRRPFEADISSAVKAGDNLVAVRVDHRRISELFLGGIVRPVLLIERPR